MRLIIVAALIFIILLTAVHAYVCLKSAGRMHSLQESKMENGFDCIIVLGCGVWGNTDSAFV